MTDVWQQAAGKNRAWIAARIPHQGAMCLLDGVVHASAAQLLCRTQSHLNKPHPLVLHSDRLGAACAVEYASQAMALHGALREWAQGEAPLFGAVAVGQTAGADPMPGGRLVSVREVQMATAYLDAPLELGGAAELGVAVQLLAGDARQASYQFAVGPLAPLAPGAPAQPLQLVDEWVSGRATVLMVL